MECVPRSGVSKSALNAKLMLQHGKLQPFSNHSFLIFSKSGSTDEEVLLKTAGFTPVEAHLYKLLTDKVLPLVVKDQRELQANSTRSRTSHPDDSANQSSVAETPSTSGFSFKNGLCIAVL